LCLLRKAQINNNNDQEHQQSEQITSELLITDLIKNYFILCACLFRLKTRERIKNQKNNNNHELVNELNLN
jgi:hypothetical protein